MFMLISSPMIYCDEVHVFWTLFRPSVGILGIRMPPQPPPRLSVPLSARVLLLSGRLLWSPNNLRPPEGTKTLNITTHPPTGKLDGIGVLPAEGAQTIYMGEINNDSLPSSPVVITMAV